MASQMNVGPELLLRRLRAISALTPPEVDLVMSLNQRARKHAPGSLICPKTDGSPHPRLIVSGWVSRPRVLPDGRCQLLSLQLPGDLVGDRGDRRPLALSPSMALTQVTTVSAQPLMAILNQNADAFANLVEAVNSIDRIEEGRLLDHIVRLGRQTALERVAHCVLELYHRLALIGFVQDGSFPMPLTQETLGDALGLSLVHVNRIISKLRRDNILEIRSGVAVVKDAEKLASIADFTPPDYSSAGTAALIGARASVPRLRLQYDS